MVPANRVPSHPEELDDEDDDGDVQLEDAPNGVPDVPRLPANGTGVSGK